MKEVKQTSRGYTIFVEPNQAGGRTYWSNSVGGGVMVWDTSLVSQEELISAIEAEYKARHIEELVEDAKELSK